jgi:hypothetical protein
MHVYVLARSVLVCRVNAALSEPQESTGWFMKVKGLLKKDQFTLYGDGK